MHAGVGIGPSAVTVQAPRGASTVPGISSRNSRESTEARAVHPCTPLLLKTTVAAKRSIRQARNIAAGSAGQRPPQLIDLF